MRSRGTAARALSARATAAGVLVGAMLVGGVAGCTGGEPAPTPSRTGSTVTTSATPTPTPTPTPTDPAAVPPVRPDAMNTVDTAGAEAFATYYVQLVPYVYATGDVQAYSAHSHPECIFCADVARRAEEQAAAGGHTTGGLIDVRTVSALEIDPGKWWAVSMEMVQAPLKDLDSEGDVVAEAGEAAYHVDMSVVLVDGRWRMREVTPVEAA